MLLKICSDLSDREKLNSQMRKKNLNLFLYSFEARASQTKKTSELLVPIPCYA